MARSNRGMTIFTVGKIQEYLDLGPARFREGEVSNTKVHLEVEDDTETLIVSLFGAPIAEIFFVDGKFDQIIMDPGTFFDNAGLPSRTHRERLNGILDLLGDNGLIPENVRVFLADQHTRCFIGRGETCVPFGKGYEEVAVVANPVTLEFAE